MKEKFIETKKDWLCQSLEGTYGAYNLDISSNAKEHVTNLKKLSKQQSIQWEEILPYIGVLFSDRLAKKYVNKEYNLIVEELLNDWIEIEKTQKVFEKEKSKALNLVDQAQSNFEEGNIDISLKKIEKAIAIEEKYQDDYNTFSSLAEDIKECFK